jgi:hypothetical protein
MNISGVCIRQGERFNFFAEQVLSILRFMHDQSTAKIADGVQTDAFF